MSLANIRGPSLNAILTAAAIVHLAAARLYAQTVDDVARAWEERRTGIDTLRCVLVGEQTFHPGCFDTSIAHGMGAVPEGTKPPLPAEEHKLPYQYAVQFDLKKHRARVETTSAIFVSKSLSFHLGDSIRTFDGDFTKSLEPKDVSVAPDAVQFHDTGADYFGYTSELPALFACGYAPPQRMRRQEPYIMSSQPIERLSINGKAEFRNRPVVVVRSTPDSKQPEHYDEYWTDPNSKYRIVKWFRYYFQQLKMSIEIGYADDIREQRPTTFVSSYYSDEGKLQETYTVKVKDWSVNVPVQKPDFVLQPDSKMILLTKGD
jgi:hypothetical protein